MRVWVIECWENFLTPSVDGSFHNVSLVNIVENEEIAKEYCRNNQDYAGLANDWHWRIHSRNVSNNPANREDEPFGEHWTIDMQSKCDIDGMIIATKINQDQQLPELQPRALLERIKDLENDRNTLYNLITELEKQVRKNKRTKNRIK